LKTSEYKEYGWFLRFFVVVPLLLLVLLIVKATGVNVSLQTVWNGIVQRHGPVERGKCAANPYSKSFLTDRHGGMIEEGPITLKFSNLLFTDQCSPVEGTEESKLDTEPLQVFAVQLGGSIEALN
jgi:hypothetical protein